jgi:outer membrane protein assembly factor BamB/predicted phosphodiesterase
VVIAILSNSSLAKNEYLGRMKRICSIFLFGLLALSVNAQVKSFRFAFISDTHIGSPDGKAEEDLKRTVADINTMSDISFVVITGDITELGTDDEIHRAKQILDGLKVKWYIIPGNHDTGWSESGALTFSKVFGDDKFSFEYKGIRFIGCASGPYLRMSDGHVPRSAINWLDSELIKLSPGQPVIFLNHYPIDNSLDNWYEITDRLRQYNTWAILCGHGHANKAMNFEDIPATMGRSNLRAKDSVGGYNLVDLRSDSMLFTVRRPGTNIRRQWTGIKIETRHYDLTRKFDRPTYIINEKYPATKAEWTYSSDANIISTPIMNHGIIIAGNQNGKIVGISGESGAEKWSFQTSGPIYSSPANHGDNVIVGSSDGFIYCLNALNGNLNWKILTSGPVLGSPLVTNDIIYVGNSHSLIALDAKAGNKIWSYDSLKGPMMSIPVKYDNKIIFGAWDTYLYALNEKTGSLMWKWTNGSTVRNYSPASCIPVISKDIVFVVAPDRYITAIDEKTGNTLWRNNDATVRESIGISEDGQTIYGKTMQDTIVAYRASAEKQSALWKMHVGFGYEHVPSMLYEKNGQLFFGTKNGVIYSIDPIRQSINWEYKVDNSMVNTIRLIQGNKILASTMDGKIVLIKYP